VLQYAQRSRTGPPDIVARPRLRKLERDALAKERLWFVRQRFGQIMIRGSIAYAFAYTDCIETPIMRWTISVLRGTSCRGLSQFVVTHFTTRASSERSIAAGRH